MKKIISYIICFIMLLTFASCGNNDYIGVDKAKQTVVDDIGAAVEDVEFALNDLVNDKNGDYYHMRFTKDGTEYIYKVDAVNGNIIEKKSNYTDNDDNSNGVNNQDNTDNSGITDNSNNSTNAIIDNNDTNNATSNNNGASNNNNNTSNSSIASTTNM